jgi:hypothetical protein
MNKILTKVSLPIAPRNQAELKLIDKERAELKLSRPDYLFERSRQLRQMEQYDVDRIATALERIAEKLDHLHIDAIDHNHVEGDVNTHAKTW